MGKIKTLVSVSWGKDSLAQLIYAIENGITVDEAVFYDTGMEFNATYKMRDRALPILQAHGIKYIELKPDYDFLYKMFEKPVIRNSERSCERCRYYKIVSSPTGICNNPQSKYYQMHDEYQGGLPSEKTRKGSCVLLELKQHTKFGYSWCGGRCRWGTTDKLKALDRYAEERSAQILVGIAADETKRLEKERKPYKRFLLAEIGMTEADCLKFCYERGFDWEENGIRLYDILDRVSCWCCANKNLKELKNIYQSLPEYWDRLKGLQQRTDRPMKGPRKSVFDLERRFGAEIEADRKQKSLFDWATDSGRIRPGP